MKFIFLTLFLYISISAENLKDLQVDFEDSESLKEVEDFSTLSLSPSLLTREDEEDLYGRIFGRNSPKIIAGSRAEKWNSLETLGKKNNDPQADLASAVVNLKRLLNRNNLQNIIQKTLINCYIGHQGVDAKNFKFMC
ncbi:UNVERIFIED_CONTAM: hypothetical protein RMT77_003900 [Armadillidium vulgare]